MYARRGSVSHGVSGSRYGSVARAKMRADTSGPDKQFRLSYELRGKCAAENPSQLPSLSPSPPARPPARLPARLPTCKMRRAPGATHRLPLRARASPAVCYLSRAQLTASRPTLAPPRGSTCASRSPPTAPRASHSRCLMTAGGSPAKMLRSAPMQTRLAERACTRSTSEFSLAPILAPILPICHAPIFCPFITAPSFGSARAGWRLRDSHANRRAGVLGSLKCHKGSCAPSAIGSRFSTKRWRATLEPELCAWGPAHRRMRRARSKSRSLPRDRLRQHLFALYLHRRP